MTFKKGNTVGKQFQKGVSGNPKGRPMDTINVKDMIEKILNKEITRTDHLDLGKKTQKIADHLLGGLMAKALGKEGDIDSIDNKSVDMVLDRLDGKAVNRTQEVPPSLEDALKLLDEEDKKDG